MQNPMVKFLQRHFHNLNQFLGIPRGLGVDNGGQRDKNIQDTFFEVRFCTDIYFQTENLMVKLFFEYCQTLIQFLGIPRGLVVS